MAKPIFNGNVSRVSIYVTGVVIIASLGYFFNHTLAVGHPIITERVSNLQKSVDHNTVLLEKIDAKLP